MLPVLSRTLRASEAASSGAAAGKRMRAALRRRARVAEKYAHTQEHGAVFKVGGKLTTRHQCAVSSKSSRICITASNSESCTGEMPVLNRQHDLASLTTAAEHRIPQSENLNADRNAAGLCH